MGGDALEVKELNKAFGGKTVFRNVSFHLRAGDRVALIGPNGVGKTTLFKILNRKETPDSGTVRYRRQTWISGITTSTSRTLTESNTVLAEVHNAFPSMEQSRLRSALGQFLFTGDDVFSKIASLSGGERGRVALTKLMLKKDNFLLLDEPTNHLDMDSCEVLEDALSDFPGVIFAISHDRYFVNRFAERVMVMAEDGVTEYLGNFDDYLAKRDQPRAAGGGSRRPDENRDDQGPKKRAQTKRSLTGTESCGRRSGSRDRTERTTHDRVYGRDG